MESGLLIVWKTFFCIVTKGSAFLQQKTKPGKDSDIFKYFSVLR